MINDNIKSINFVIDKQIYSHITKFTDEELNIISKQLFDDWYNKKYNQNSDMSEQFEKYENRIKTEIDDKFSTINNNITDLNKTTKDLFGISNNSQRKGEMMENIIYDYFKNNLQNYTFNRTNHISHNADAHLITPEKQDILLEIKNYQNAVDKKEIDKLKYDMQYTKIKYGLFLSIQSGIVGKKSIDIEYFMDKDNNTYYIMYVSYILDESHKIQSGLSVLETIYKLNQTYNHTRIDYIEDKILDNLKEVANISDMVTNLRKQYQTLEQKIKDNIDDYYQLIRDYEIQIRTKINNLWITITTELNTSKEILLKCDDLEILLEENKDTDIFVPLSKIIDIFKNKNLNIIDKQYIYKGSEKIGEYKIYQKKVEVLTYRPQLIIKLNKKSENYEYKFLECILVKKDFK